MAKSNKKSVRSIKSIKEMSPKMHMKAVMHEHGYFMGLLAVFVAFSLYAVVSFSASTNNYINGMYASVLGNSEVQPVEEYTAYEIFIDLKSDAPHAVAIEKLRDLGVLGGYTDGTFKPDKLVTRGEAVAVLETAADIDFSGASYGDCFKDVKNEWFAVPVCYAKNQGWVSGLKNGNFKPAEGVKYPEILKVAITVFGFEVPAKVDFDPIGGVKFTDWSAPYFKTAVDYGIIGADFVFDSKHQMTRAEFAELVYQIMKAKRML
ncbi:MAG: S-layer homology domain-containing protein [Candidatus Gracilibacteria bacterium]|jgi:hypothetical protein